MEVASASGNSQTQEGQAKEEEDKELQWHLVVPLGPRHLNWGEIDWASAICWELTHVLTHHPSRERGPQHHGSCQRFWQLTDTRRTSKRRGGQRAPMASCCSSWSKTSQLRGDWLSISNLLRTYTCAHSSPMRLCLWLHSGTIIIWAVLGGKPKSQTRSTNGDASASSREHVQTRCSCLAIWVLHRPLVPQTILSFHSDLGREGQLAKPVLRPHPCPRCGWKAHKPSFKPLLKWSGTMAHDVSKPIPLASHSRGQSHPEARGDGQQGKWRHGLCQTRAPLGMGKTKASSMHLFLVSAPVSECPKF